MDQRGQHTSMPRAALPRGSERSESIVWGMAYGIAALFALGQVLFVLTAAPAAIAFHRETGSVNAFVSAVAAIGAPGLIALLLAVDALILATFIRLARRHWIGFAYVPPLLYFGIGTVVVWLLVADALWWIFLRG